MKCRNCNWPNRPGEKKCIKCGASLTEAPAQSASPTQPLQPDQPVQPIQPVQPGRPANPAQPVQQVAPRSPQPVPQQIRPQMPPQGNPQPAPQGGRQPFPGQGTPTVPNQPMQPPVTAPGQAPAPAYPQEAKVCPPQGNLTICPRCNYTLRPGMEECPNCNYRLVPGPKAAAPQGAPQQRPAQSARAAAPQSGAIHRPTVTGLPEVSPQGNAGVSAPATGAAPAPQGNQNAPHYRGTVNVYTDAPLPDLSPKFSLTPVQKINETVPPRPLEFEGQEAILNRANTDPENLSITSRQQASVSRVNGRWVISDLSDQQTTFIHPAKGHELHDGDIILLGNRLFVFKENC